MRGEIPGEPRWTYSGTKLETADTAKENLQLTGLLYSEQILTLDPERRENRRLPSARKTSSNDLVFLDAQAACDFT